MLPARFSSYLVVHASNQHCSGGQGGWENVTRGFHECILDALSVKKLAI